MVVQASPDLVRKATASGVALTRPAHNSTSVLPVTPAMTMPPQLTGGWPAPPSNVLWRCPLQLSNVDYGPIGDDMEAASAIRSAAGGWLASRYAQREGARALRFFTARSRCITLKASNPPSPSD